MNAVDSYYIQTYTIGYSFQNPGLLTQAFTRKSYAEEHPGTLHNEVLEFYGDKALEMVVMKRMSNFFGAITASGEYSSNLSEGELTEIKKGLVNKSMLAHRIDLLNLKQYLLMGKGDILQNANDEESVKEDLFEAIVGAVAIDSGWDVSCIEKTVEAMHEIEYYLVNGLLSKNSHLDKLNKESSWDESVCYSISEVEDGFKSILIIDGEEVSVGSGVTPDGACHKAVEDWWSKRYWENVIEDIKKNIGEPSLEKAINQLQELSQKKLINKVVYSFTESFDIQGNPVWSCKCSIEGLENYCEASNSSKKDCKKEAALKMLRFLINSDTK